MWVVFLHTDTPPIYTDTYTPTHLACSRNAVAIARLSSSNVSRESSCASNRAHAVRKGPLDDAVTD